MSKFDQTLFNRIVNSLVPYMGDIETRKTLIKPIFISYEDLYSQIDWSGASKVFTVRLVGLFSQYDEVETDLQALFLLLQELRTWAGVGDRRTIDYLIYQLLETRQISPVISNQSSLAPDKLTPTPPDIVQKKQRKAIPLRFITLLLLIPIVALIAYYLGKGEYPEILKSATADGISVVGDVKITPKEPKVGDTVTVEVLIQSERTEPFQFEIHVTGRGPDACQKDWDAPHINWPMYSATLEPGDIHTYRESKKFDISGNYFAQAGIIPLGGKWSSVEPHTQAWFDILRIDGEQLVPQCLLVTNDSVGYLNLSSLHIQRGEEVMLTYKIRNNQPESISLIELAAKATLPDTEPIFFPLIQNFELAPNNEYIYSESKQFNNSGDYTIEPYYKNIKNYSLSIWPYPEIKLVVE